MSSTQEHHHKLTDGEGKCSVPMWMGGLPEGFCDKPAYGERPHSPIMFKHPWSGDEIREDGKYNGYVPGLACSGHGGPKEMVKK